MRSVQPKGKEVVVLDPLGGEDGAEDMILEDDEIDGAAGPDTLVLTVIELDKDGNAADPDALELTMVELDEDVVGGSNKLALDDPELFRLDVSAVLVENVLEDPGPLASLMLPDSDVIDVVVALASVEVSEVEDTKSPPVLRLNDLLVLTTLEGGAVVGMILDPSLKRVKLVDGRFGSPPVEEVLDIIPVSEDMEPLVLRPVEPVLVDDTWELG